MVATATSPLKMNHINPPLPLPPRRRTTEVEGRRGRKPPIQRGGSWLLTALFIKPAPAPPLPLHQRHLSMKQTLLLLLQQFTSLLKPLLPPSLALFHRPRRRLLLLLAALLRAILPRHPPLAPPRAQPRLIHPPLPSPPPSHPPSSQALRPRHIFMNRLRRPTPPLPPCIFLLERLPPRL